MRSIDTLQPGEGGSVTTLLKELTALIDKQIIALPTERDMFTRRQVIDILLDLRIDVATREAFEIIQAMLRTGMRFRDLP